MDVDPGGHLGAVRALQHLGHATRELDAFKTARHLSGGVGEDLSVLQADECRQLVAMGRQELPQMEQPVGALTQG